MKTAYFDCFSGAAGDMILGALLDAGLDFARLEAELANLGLAGFRIEAEKVTRGGIAGTKLHVHLDDEHHHHPHSDDRLEDGHLHGRHRTDDAHGRGLPEILRLIGQAALPDAVKLTASRVFRRLADAEAEVHGKPPEEIHFHEVGAVDAIVDIVGAAIGLHLLGIERVHCSPMRTGTGTVRCAHGELPVPAPATALLLRGVPVIPTDVQAELTTPTGAAILTTIAAEFGPMPPGRIDAIGYGAGSRDNPGLPNLLRVFIAETAAGGYESDVVEVIEANLDDMSPEFFGVIFDRLFAAGAVDAWVTPIQMKKSRPAFLLSAIAPMDRGNAVREVFFRETTTFGVRSVEARRSKLPREVHEVETPLGRVRIKVGSIAGKIVRAKAEHDDCARIAAEKNVPFREVQDAAMRAFLSTRA